MDEKDLFNDGKKFVPLDIDIPIGKDIVPLPIKLDLIEEQRQRWLNTQYQATVNLRVSLKIKNKRLEEEATALIRESEMALMELETIVKELKQGM
jgi:hypothetical protein